jgi:hypothetical protein
VHRSGLAFARDARYLTIREQPLTVSETQNEDRRQTQEPSGGASHFGKRKGPRQCFGRRGIVAVSSSHITVERLERAITITAKAMSRHNLPQLLPTLKRLEAERDKLLMDGDPIAYAKRILAHQAA